MATKTIQGNLTVRGGLSREYQTITGTTIPVTPNKFSIQTISQDTTYTFSSNTEASVINEYAGQMVLSVNASVTFPSGILWNYDSNNTDISLTGNIFALASGSYEFSVINNLGVLVRYE